MLKRFIFFIAMIMAFAACQKDSLSEAAITTSADSELEVRSSFPELIPLPDGFSPEGIVAGTGTDFYVGSLIDGSIYKGDFRDGSGEVWYTPDAPQMAVGLAFDQRTKYLYVSGGGTGMGFVLDTETGAEVASYDFGGSFVNDVIVSKDAAYFTDSFSPNIYKLPVSSGGEPGTSVESLTLSGDFTFVPGAFNANGIEVTPDGNTLIVVNGGVGELYVVDPDTGVATLIDLAGGNVLNGDGILLRGKTLYVVQNFLNQIAVVSLADDYLSGTITGTLTDPDFQIPTTVTRHGGTLYAVNARFDVAPPGAPSTGISFAVVQVDK